MLSHTLSALASIAVHFGAIMSAGVVVTLLALHSGDQLIGTPAEDT